MFLVFNREKVCTYIVSLLTVLLLFCTVATFKADRKEETEASSNAEKSIIIDNEIKDNNINKIEKDNVNENFNKSM